MKKSEYFSNNTADRKKKLIEQLEEFYEATHIPISFFHGKELLAHFSGPWSDLNFPMFLMEGLPDELPMLWYSSMEKDVLFAGISVDWKRGNPTSYMVFLGPVLPYECGQKLGAHLISRLGQKPKDITILCDYFNEHGRYHTTSLLASLQILAKLLHIHAPKDATLLRYDWNERMPFEPTPYAQLGSTDETLERELFACIRHGQPQAVDAILLRNLGEGELVVPLKRYYIYSAIGLASRIAVNSGVDYSLAQSIEDAFLERLLQCQSNQDTGNIFHDAFRVYAEQVARLKQLDTKNPLIQKINSYIQSHLYEKLTPSILAECLNYDVTYLCGQFKREMGMTISCYVNECKIEEAKRLLEEGRKTLTDIAITLAYPSQGYFCSVFKKYTDMTPSSYQKKAQKKL